MSNAFSTWVLLAILGMSGCAEASGRTVRLVCPGQDDLARALCQTVRAQLVQRGHHLAKDAMIELRLEASAPTPRRLLARLSVTGAAGRTPAEQGELSVIDRATPPQQQLEDFAAGLIDRLGPGF